MIKKLPCPLEEQETIVNVVPKQINEKAFVYTTIPSELKRLWKLHKSNPDDVLIVRDDKYGTEFAIPRRWVTIRKPRAVSEEQRRASAERFAMYRAQKKEEEA